MKAITLSLILMSSVSLAKAPPSMYEMAVILGQLLPEVLNDSSSNKDIMPLIKRLQAASHDLSDEKKVLAQDPAMQFIAKKLSFELSLIDAKLLSRESLVTRNVLLKTMSYCISWCPTKARPTISNSVRPWPSIQAPGREQEKALFYAATRDFSKAILNYEKALGDGKFKSKQPQKWFRDLQRLIALVIRSKKSPALTKEMASFFIDRNKDHKLLSGVKSLAKSFEQWSKEPPEPKTKAGKFKKAQELFELGLSTDKKTNHGGYIYHVRALDLVQEVINMPPPDKLLSNGFHLAGQISSAIAQSQIFPLSQVYFEACIRNNPKSDLAKTCYKELKSARMKNLKNGSKVPDLYGFS